MPKAVGITHRHPASEAEDLADWCERVREEARAIYGSKVHRVGPRWYRIDNIADAITLCGDVTQGCGPATQIVVRKNDVENNGGSGILLLGANSNLLKSNQVQGNGTAGGDTTDGIRVDTNSTNNQILENHMTGNVTHDCHDDSNGSGSGTPPTANTWTNDQGDTQNRDGLCRGATTTP